MNNIVGTLTDKIKEFKEQEWQAREAKDYAACMYLYGTIIQFEKLLKEIEDEIVLHNT